MDLPDSSICATVNDPLSVMILNLMGTKTNSNLSNRDYGVALRHRYPLTCTIGAISFYLVQRYTKLDWPSFKSNGDWFQTKVQNHLY